MVDMHLIAEKMYKNFNEDRVRHHMSAVR